MASAARTLPVPRPSGPDLPPSVQSRPKLHLAQATPLSLGERQGEGVLTSLPADPCSEPQFPSKIDPVTFKVRTFRTTFARELGDFGDGSARVEVQSDGNAEPL